MKLKIGVNLFGAEAENAKKPLPGKYGYDYRYPDPAEADYFTEKGFNIFRLPVKWERWQPDLNGDLSQAELERAEPLIQHITEKLNLPLIFDVHNYGKRRLEDGITEREIGEAPVRVGAFVDLWRRLAKQFANNRNIIFCVMNEPISQEADEWADYNQSVIDAIRETGAKNKLQLSGVDFTSAHTWYGSGNAKAFLSLRDPLNYFEVETHIYGDQNANGMDGIGAVVSDLVFSLRLKRFTDWCRRYGYRAFLGEIGISAGAEALSAMKETIRFLEENSDVWSGVTFWGGGDKLHADYPFRLTPHPFPGGGDKAQIILAQEILQPKPEKTAKFEIDFTQSNFIKNFIEYFEFSRNSAGYSADIRGKLSAFENNIPRVSNEGLLLEKAAVAAFPIWQDGYFKDSFRPVNVTVETAGIPPEGVFTLIDTPENAPHYLGFDANLAELTESAGQSGRLCFYGLTRK